MSEYVRLKIVVDKQEIETNEFVQNVIGKAIAGSVSVLKGVNEDWEEIEVTVRRETK
jgi:hypothetical protein